MPEYDAACATGASFTGVIVIATFAVVAVVAFVVAEESGTDPAALAASVNQKMKVALAATKEFAAVKARSGSYQTYPVYNKGRIETWRVTQQLRLESADFAAMARLLGRLQQDLLLRGMSVGLSREARRSAEDALIAEAIAAFHARAGLVREAMKAPGYRVQQLHVNASGGIIRPLMMESVARPLSSAAVPPPAIESGVSVVTVNVSGTIELAK